MQLLGTDEAVTICPMLPADVSRAAAAVLRGGWGDREAFFRFAAGHETCRTFLAESGEAGSDVVGTGVATISGRVGWVGTIWVAPERRGRGLGTALTEVVADALTAAGCATLLLVATEAGRRVYERLGFDVLTWGHTFNPPSGDVAPSPGAIRPFAPIDLDEACALDAWATGEDRRHVLSLASGWALPDDTGLRGFWLRAPFGGVGTIARTPADGLALLEHRRSAAPRDERVRAGTFRENEEGRARLVEAGWTESWQAVRMIRGAPLSWDPAGIWSHFNHAIG